ncbi:MAG TPA: hypothetical protein VLF89_07355 [Candidatus Saccharimonadales bacterium]|nr:hypothetical protein [Candidatus Saccharimonadales bacterium]
MVKKYPFVFFLSFLLLFFLFSHIISRAFAQVQTNGLDITVSPYVLELSNIPGSKIQSQIRIRNNLDQQIPLQISVGKLAANGDSFQPIEATKDDESLRWISFDQASISARPKEWTQVKFTLNIPKTAAFGYYYVIRIKQVSTGNTQKNTAAKVLGEVLVPILLEVKSEGAVASAKIIDFKPNSFINEYVPVNFITQVQNTGNIHIKPRGNIFIHTAGENDTTILDVNETQRNILPGGTRTFTTSWDDGFIVREPVVEDGEILLDKNKQPVTHLVVNWNNLTHFRIGKYTANLLLVYDNGKRDVPIEATTTFWVFPYTIIGIGIVSIIIIILLIRFLIKLVIKRELKKYKNG